MRASFCCVFFVAVLFVGCDDGGAGEGEGEEGEGEEGEGDEGEGEPPPVCPDPLGLVDVAGAAIVGDGTAGSCSEAAVKVAFANGGVVAFDCGPDPVVIDVAAALVVDKDLVVDGGGLVAFDGGGATRILELVSTFDKDTPRLVLQRLRFQNGNATGGNVDGGGGAVFRTGGSLDVVDCAFVGNRGNALGQDTAGGAIFSLGGGFTTVVGSTFDDNSASNGGALGNLGNDLVVVNSVFRDNAATGDGGNPGNGGNGGTISIDGEGRDVQLCGVRIEGSAANAFGGAVFRVSYQGTEPTVIERTVIRDAVIPDRSPSMAGGLYLQNTTVTMTSSTILNCSASAAGGAYFGPGSTVTLENVSLLDNVAASSLGGGVFFDGVVGGRVTNCTIAGNAAPGEVAFGGAIVGDGSNLTMTNTLIVDNRAGNGFNPVSCTTSCADGAGSIQFPVERSGGGSDDPDALCADDIGVSPVVMQSFISEFGVVPVRAVTVSSTSVVVVGHDCPAEDALGNARADPCTAGAVEALAPID